MLRNSRFTAFTVFELLKENQLEVMGGGEVILPIPRHTHRLGLILIILEVLVLNVHVFQNRNCYSSKSDQ